jgi:phage FluMu protein Com
VAYLRCPECKLTAHATAYYLRGDQCPRCMTSMEPYARPRPANASAPPRPLPRPGRADGAQKRSQQQAV